jgi:phage/plasmid-like protein (TIGR03299 family)
MFSAGELPWHGLGINVQSKQTAAGALELAGLDWEVYFRPVYMAGQDETGKRVMRKIQERVATCRKNKDGGDHFLGVVGEDYQIVQNVAAFDFMDAIVGEGQAIYETAGAIREGRRVWILAKLPEGMTIGKKDHIDNYLLLANSHDGTLALQCRFTPVRCVCSNTLSLALSAQTPYQVKIRHSGNIKAKVNEARQLLGIAKTYFDEVGAVFNQFLMHKMNDTEVKNYFTDVFPAPKIAEGKKSTTPSFDAAITRHEKIISQLVHNHEAGAGSEMARGTLWGSLNAVSEFLDHDRYMNKPLNAERRFNSITTGSGWDIRQRAFGMAKELAGVS